MFINNLSKQSLFKIHMIEINNLKKNFFNKHSIVVMGFIIISNSKQKPGFVNLKLFHTQKVRRKCQKVSVLSMLKGFRRKK